MNSTAQVDQQRGIGPRLLVMWKEDKMRGDSLEPFSRGLRQHSRNFGQRSLNRLRRLPDLQPRACQQTQRNGRGLLFSKDERRQFKAGTKPVASIATDI